MECEQEDEIIPRRQIGPEDKVYSFEGSNGMIEIVAVKNENSTALSDLYDAIADIMINQARLKAKKEAAQKK